MLRPRSKQLAAVCLGMGLLAITGAVVSSRITAQRNAQRQRDFQPRRAVPPQRPITDPPVIAADRVRAQVTANELVLGVEVGGEARAYPINMLTGPQREIINDALGGVPIAATW